VSDKPTARDDQPVYVPAGDRPPSRRVANLACRPVQEDLNEAVTPAEAERIDGAMFEAFDEIARHADDLASSDDGASYVARMTQRVRAALEAEEAARAAAAQGRPSRDVSRKFEAREAGTAKY
jgi:hypothetical protein